MTATLGVTFGAGSAIKRILLFAINVTVLLLGITCSILCLHQVKLMPETYDVIVAALLESNLTTATPIPSLTITAIGIRNTGRNTTRSGASNNGRPRVSRYVSPKNDKASNQQIPVYPVTSTTTFTSSIETGITTPSYLDVQNLDITKGMALPGTGKTASLTASLAKSSVAGSNITIARVVTPTSLTNTMEEKIDFSQVLKDRIAELENELRLVHLREKAGKFTEQENQTSRTVSSPIPFPMGTFNFTDIQISSIAHVTPATVTNWPSILIPTAAIQLLTEPTTSTSTTTKTSSYPTRLTTTSLSASLASSTPTALFSSTPQQSSAVASTTKPAGTPIMLTTTPSKESTGSITVAPRTIPMVKSTTATATRLASTQSVSIAKSTTSTALPTPTAPTSGTTSTVSTTRKTSAVATEKVSASTTTATKVVTKLPKTELADTPTTLSITFDDAPYSIESSKEETFTLLAAEVSLTSLNLMGPDVTSPKPQLNPMNASLNTEAQAAFVTLSSDEQVSLASIKAMSNLPPTTSLLLPLMQAAIPLTTPLMATSLSSSTEKASTSSSMITATGQTLPTMNATTSSVLSSTKSISTLTTTPSSIGFINLTGVLDSISKLVGRRDLSAHRLRKRSSSSTVAPAIKSADTLTADHIPIYFEQVFFFVQTSLYVCTAAGLLIFFSSLVGICGGLFRIDGCLKFSVAALVLVIMAEMATAAFIFVAHDKASNRNKNKNFDRDLKLLCELANFCIQPILLIITGSFLCISVVLQIGSITLACNLMDNRTETDPDKKMRRMMRSNHSNFQFGAGSMQMNPYSNPMPMQMPMPYCGGGGYGGMSGNLFPYPSPMMMPMQNMGYYPPVFNGPGQRPIVNIIS